MEVPDRCVGVCVPGLDYDRPRRSLSLLFGCCCWNLSFGDGGSLTVLICLVIVVVLFDFVGSRHAGITYSKSASQEVGSAVGFSFFLVRAKEACMLLFHVAPRLTQRGRL